MKIGKILILMMIVCSLLIAMMNFAVAVDEIILEDEKDDVSDDITGEYTDDKPNIDIKKLTCSKENEKVTFELTVEGVIENKGNLDSLRLIMDPEYWEEITANMTEEELMEFITGLSFDLVGYIFLLVTTENDYFAMYVNDGVLVYNDTGGSIANTFSVNGNVLTVSFDLPDDSEQINASDVAAEATEISDTISYSDGVYSEDYNGDDDDTTGDDDDTTGDDDDSTNGANGDDHNGDSSDSGLLLFVAIIAIVVIIGVIVLIFIIRR